MVISLSSVPQGFFFAKIKKLLNDGNGWKFRLNLKIAWQGKPQENDKK